MTERKLLTRDEVVRLLRDIAREYPDHVDPAAQMSTDCQYFYGNEWFVHHYSEPRPVGPPRCIAGEVFHRAGVSDDDLALLPTELVNPTLHLPSLDLTSEAIDLLRTAQYLQDKGHSWSDVVRRVL